ncbi:hypothetical protein CDD81_5080 [Ophiocordyceps australis]|uniref:TauD/TfdA-like domain-containing protein n=1 Tax=Ophiocordyceps australis TaxID=1399860 RepID=A0A2C5XV80_9HYPO|nr:hypothetical protein CDD81_5080 [Ophiocordyceps australis]
MAIVAAHKQDIESSLFKESTLPASQALSGPLVWTGADFDKMESYSLILTPQQVKEVDSALENFKSLALDVDDVAQANFCLPNLGPRLDMAAKQVHEGRGFVVVKGLDASRYSPRDSVIIFLGISAYIADQRGLQDQKGNVLSHITSSKLWHVPQEKRHGIHSRNALPFHSDMGCDIHGLQVRHCAEKGGYTYLSSAWTIFNKLMSCEPGVIKILMTPDWPVQICGTAMQYYMAPIFSLEEARLMASVDPQRLGPHAASKAGDIPRLTAAQEYALERVARVAEQVELQLQLGQGDVVFFNNWALLHRRDGYEDGQHTSRHLVRLWLRNSQLGWSVAASMLKPWLAAYGKDLINKPRLYPLQPMPTYTVPKYTTGSAAFVVEQD